jgi:glycosyltransferase involved in cell wall biosynthesis
MRVCLISKQFNPSGGGSERYAYELATTLADRGHSVDVFALGVEDSLSNLALPDTLDVTLVAKRRRYLVTFETLYYSVLTRYKANFEEYDVVHGTLMPASPIALTIAPTSTPLVVTSHGTSIGEVRSHKLEVPTDYLKKFAFHPMNVVMDAATVPRSSRVISISSIAQQELKQYYPINDKKLVQIPHGVDIDRFRPDHPLHQAPNPNLFTFLHVGRLVSRKHTALALEALATSDRDDIELLIAGTGSHRDRLEKLTKQLGISRQVSFLGFVPEEELPSLYASSDAFLFLSRYEGFGLTFLEAMASGLPVVGTPVGGFPDLVTDGQEGFLVDRDAEDITQAIERLADKPSRAKEMGRYARKLAETRTWDDVGAETEAVYESVVR